MAVSTDFGNEYDIHPTPKRPVGERLALAARANTYGEKIVYSGPMYSGVKIEGNKAVVSFDHIGSGLIAKEMVPTLERKNKALEDYAFINAHNLRSPVASILGLINLLVHVKDEKESKEIMEHMKISAERLDEVVHTITESIERSDRLEAFNSADGDDGVD